MSLIEFVIVAAALGLHLAAIRFAVLAFLPRHPLARLIRSLDRLTGRGA